MKLLFSPMIILTLTLFLSSEVSAHFFDSSYQCISTRTSKRTGKARTHLYYYNPEKNWNIRLGSVKNKSSFKVANLYTPEGRYDGTYKGVYPNLKEIKFMTYWPYKVKRAVKVYSKFSKSDCSVLKDSSVFDLPYLNKLECMDPKGLGTCKAIGR